MYILGKISNHQELDLHTWKIIFNFEWSKNKLKVKIFFTQLFAKFWSLFLLIWCNRLSIYCNLKVVSTTFVVVCFVSLKEDTCEMRKGSFCYWDDQIDFLDIHMFWCHQMAKHETLITFYWISSEINNVLMKFGQFM